jgi:uncharacterized SAM-binding protein YcdF (DUF218 family)
MKKDIFYFSLPKAILFILLPFFLALCSAVGVLGIRLFLIFPWKASELLVADPLQPCDLIVFLGGEYYERIDYAFQLAEQGYSDTIYTPSVGYKQSRERIIERLKGRGSVIHFFEGEKASSTYEEALQTRSFVKKYSIKSILLVTSPYHSLRASWIFRKVMPGLKIISAPCGLDDNKLGRDLKRYYPHEKQKFLLYYLCYVWWSYDF